jgi:hypothetical protein
MLDILGRWLFKLPPFFFFTSILLIMARIVYGALATEIRGSIGGTTFQGNAYGFSVKNKANMARLQSERQREAHRRLDYVVKGWQQISQEQRDKWTAWAIAHPVQASNNPSAILDGYGYWLKYNLMHTMWVSTYLAAPNEGTLSLPSLTPYVNNSAGVLAINPVPSFEASAIFFNLYMSPPIPPTKGFSDSYTRAIIVLPVTSGNADITSYYNAVFGSIPPSGSRIMVELQLWGGSIPYIFGSQKFILEVS